MDMFNKQPPPQSTDDLVNSMGVFNIGAASSLAGVRNDIVLNPKPAKSINPEDVVKMIANMPHAEATEFVSRIQDRIVYNLYKSSILEAIANGSFYSNPARGLILVVVSIKETTVIVTVMTETEASQLKSNSELFTKIEEVEKVEIINLLKDWDAQLQQTYHQSYKQLFAAITGASEDAFYEESSTHDGR